MSSGVDYELLVVSGMDGDLTVGYVREFGEDLQVSVGLDKRHPGPFPVRRTITFVFCRE